MSSEVTAQVLLEVSNDFNGVAMVLEGLNEESVGIASIFRELFSSSFNFLKSVFSPGLPGFNVKDLFLNVFNVSLGSLPVVLVDVGNKGQVTNGLGTNSFVSLVLGISSNLGFKVFGLKVSEEVIDGFNGVEGTSSGLDEGSEFADIEGRSNSEEGKNYEGSSH